MKKSERFQPIKQLIEARKLEAAKALGRSNQRLEEQEQRLRDLQQYQKEYSLYYQQCGQSGLTAAKLQDLQRFLHNLKQAVVQQQQLVEMTRRECDHKRKQLQLAHSKSMAMGKVIERFRSDEDYQAERREQKENDEMALRGKGPFRS
jgi:flagellar export protein FliJ